MKSVRTILLVLCVGCELVHGEQLLVFDDAQLRKFGWPARQGVTASPDCPALTGHFAYEGDQHTQVIDGDKKQPFSTEVTAPFFLFGNPPASRKGPDARRYSRATEVEQSARNAFWIAQNAEMVEFRRLDWRDKSRIESVTWHRAAGDFTCEGGLLLVRPPGSGGYSDGGAYEFRSEVILGLLADGSMFHFASTVYTSKALLIYRSTRKTLTYTRFKSD